MLTSAQLRAARGLLGWSQTELAERAGLGFATVQRAERDPDVITGNVKTVVKLQTALEDAGVVFIDADRDMGPGVRLARLVDRTPD